jgi:hypothetical protein
VNCESCAIKGKLKSLVVWVKRHPSWLTSKLKEGWNVAHCEHNKNIIHLLRKDSLSHQNKHLWRFLLSHGARSRLGSSVAFFWQDLQLQLQLNCTGWTPKVRSRSLIKILRQYGRFLVWWSHQAEDQYFDHGYWKKKTTSSECRRKGHQCFSHSKIPLLTKLFVVTMNIPVNFLLARANPDAVCVLADARFKEGVHVYLGLLIVSPCCNCSSNTPSKESCWWLWNVKKDTILSSKNNSTEVTLLLELRASDRSNNLTMNVNYPVSI